MIRVAGLLLIAVFALKAAVAPLHLWLPRTYAATLPVVGALFAIMTKVGVYAIIRFFTLVFPADSVIEAKMATIMAGAIAMIENRTTIRT